MEARQLRMSIQNSPFSLWERVRVRACGVKIKTDVTRFQPPSPTAPLTLAGGGSFSRCVLIAVVLFGIRVIPAFAAEPPVWELRPYRVQVFVEIDGLPELDAGSARMLADRLAERIEAIRGGAWTTTVSPVENKLKQAMFSEHFNNDATYLGSGLGSRAAETVILPHHLAYTTAKLPTCDLANVDKIILLLVSATADGYQTSAREYDVATELWNASVTRPVQQSAKIADAALDTLLQAAAPLARVSSVRGNRITLRLRAAALNPSNSELALATPGSVFRLVAHPISENAKTCLPMSIPWTFCTVEEVTREELRCRLETGLLDPLAGRWDSSIEVLALAVVPSRQPSTLVLTSTSTSSLPLIGYDIYRASSEKKPPVFVGRTDRQGMLNIAPSDDPLQILLVKHGDQWLGRLPLVVGLMPQYAMVLHDDPQNIAFEALHTRVQDAAVDNAALREMLLGRLKKRIELQQFNAAEQLLRELRQLPTERECVKSAAAESREIAADNPALQAKIDAILTEAQTALASQSDAKMLDELAEQIRKGLEPPKTP